jgi:metallo-beta-lactamase family protein
MRVTFAGAARTVTGSMHVFEHNGQKFLLECGLYQGHREEAERINRTFPFKPRDVKAVLLSHAHLDHSGNLPNLVKRAYAGSVYCTPATADIARLLLLDSAHLNEIDIEFFNKKQHKHGLPTKEPLYNVLDAEKSLEHFHSLNYRTGFSPVEGVKATFYDAGHILGSAMILLEAEGNRILFSGDIGRKNMPIIKDPDIPSDIDVLILESTYGGRTHNSFADMTEEFRIIIRSGQENRSKIVIPAFTVERTQVLATMLKSLHDDGTLAGVPVFVDSPLAVRVTGVFRNHPECFDEETYKIFSNSDPFDFDGMEYITDSEESKKLNDQQGPIIIISASGMCEGGRILHHLIHSIEDEKNIIVITGFQAQGTLGRRLLDGAPEVSIFNDRFRVRAKVRYMSGMSAHADGNDLFEYVKRIKNSRLKKVFLVHGEIDEATALKGRLDTLGLKTEIPQSMTTVDV